MNTNDDAATTPPCAAGARSAPGTSPLDSGVGWRLAASVAAVAAITCSIVGDVPIATATTLVALLPAVLVDVVAGRLPNRLVALAALGGIATLLAGSLVAGSPEPGRLLTGAALGSAAMAVPLLIVHLVAPGAMGFGDVKAAAVAGAAVGLADPVIGLVALAIGSAATAIVGLATRRQTIAFGPGIVGGAIVAVALFVSPIDPLHLEPHPTTHTTTQQVST